MKFCQKESHVRPASLVNCYRIMGNRVYVQTGSSAYFYDFKNMGELRKLQMDRVRENMKTGKVDDWECCNSEGQWSGEVYSKLSFQRKTKEQKELIEKFKKLSSLERAELSVFEIEWLEENWMYELAN